MKLCPWCAVFLHFLCRSCFIFRTLPSTMFSRCSGSARVCVIWWKQVCWWICFCFSLRHLWPSGPAHLLSGVHVQVWVVVQSEPLSPYLADPVQLIQSRWSGPGDPVQVVQSTWSGSPDPVHLIWSSWSGPGPCTCPWGAWAALVYLVNVWPGSSRPVWQVHTFLSSCLTEQPWESLLTSEGGKQRPGNHRRPSASLSVARRSISNVQS